MDRNGCHGQTPSPAHHQQRVPIDGQRYEGVEHCGLSQVWSVVHGADRDGKVGGLPLPDARLPAGRRVDGPWPSGGHPPAHEGRIDTY